MTQVPQEWRPSRPFNINFNWVDLASGVGYVQYYGGQTANDGGNEYIMQPSQFDPWHVTRNDGGDEDNSGRYNIYTLGTSDVSVADIDFDSSPFKITRKIGGKCTINIPFAFDPQVSTDKFSLYVTATVYRVIGGTTESSIGTDTSSTLTNINDGVSVSDGMLSFSFDLTETAFRNEDVLRVSLDIHTWRSSGTGTAATVMIMTDPYARDVAVTGGTGAGDEIQYTGGRPLSFFIPFKLD